MKKYLFLLFFLCILQEKLFSQEESRPKLFINCASWQCYEDFLRTELSYFDFVRDRFQADIQILIIRQENGAGGANFTLNLVGNNAYKDKNDTLFFSTKQADTDAMIRENMVRNIKISLVRLVKNKDFLENVSLDIPKRKSEDAVIKKDKWNFWVFTLGTNGWLTAESNSKSSSINNSLNINRITPKSKFQAFVNYNTTRNQFSFIDADSLGNLYKNTVNVVNTNHQSGVSWVKSLTEHWSVGGYYQNWSSIRQNISFAQSFAPAIEYNIFPTSKNTQKQLRCIAQTGMWLMDLKRTNERNFDKERIPFYRLDCILSLTQTWGTIQGSLGGHHFFTQGNLSRIDGYFNINWRIFEGFNFNFESGASYIQDQELYLPKGSVDRNAVLLGGAILPTDFSYWASFGVSYTFGSINNSVVNPRLNNMRFQ